MFGSRARVAFVGVLVVSTAMSVPCQAQEAAAGRVGVSRVATGQPAADTAARRRASLPATAGERAGARVLLSAIGATVGVATGVEAGPSLLGDECRHCSDFRRKGTAALVLGGVGAALGAALPGFAQDDRCRGFGVRLARATVGAVGGTAVGFAQEYLLAGREPRRNPLFGISIPAYLVAGASLMTVTCERS